MKQYTTPDQTAKLIELGFEKPKIIVDSILKVDGKFKGMTRYTLGELLSFLPLTVQWTPRIIGGNVIEYSFGTDGSELYYCNQNNELIDNLFDMCVKLKDEGVI